MTIRVCHNSFRKGAEIVASGLWGSTQIGVILLIPLGIMIYTGYFENPECENLSDGWKEQCYKFQNKYNGGAVIIAGSLFSGMVNLVIPWMSETRNIWQIINSKIKVFEWREDC